MTWSNGLSLEIANYIFTGLGIKFSRNEVESIYQAELGEKTLRRGTVKELSKAVCSEWLITIDEPGLR